MSTMNRDRTNRDRTCHRDRTSPGPHTGTAPMPFTGKARRQPANSVGSARTTIYQVFFRADEGNQTPYLAWETGVSRLGDRAVTWGNVR